MATSGTIGAITTTCGYILDSAFRRCKKIPQLVASEDINVAKRLLGFLLTMLANKGIVLSVVDSQLTGLRYGKTNVQLPVGNIALLNSNLREIQRIAGTPTASSGASANAYDQDLSTVCTTDPDGNIDILFSSSQPQQVTQIGILPAATGSWTFSIQWSDGFTWHTFQNQIEDVTSGTWLWYGVDQITQAEGIRIQASGGTVLSVYEVVCGNNPSDIPLQDIDRDTYSQLSNKKFYGRPTQYWYDRRIANPVMRLWPTPDSNFELTFLIVNYITRQPEDVGTMAQTIELPDRWLLPLIADLARNLARELKEVPPEVLPDLDQEATRLLKDAWDAESSGGDSRFIPNIAGYTA